MGTKRGVTKRQHNFAQIPHAEIQRSSFNRSCGVKTTFDAGELIPIFVDEALPGDTFNMRMHLFSRVATLLFPIMDNMYMDVFFFSVPNRLIWENWEKFNGAQDDPGDSTDFLVPQMNSGIIGFTENSLEDYFGMPTKIQNLPITALYHRAYNLIWNSWFRDENLQDRAPVNIDDGPDGLGDYQILKRGKRHDYFTSCLPFPQKADAIELPLGGSAPVTIDTAQVFNVDANGTPTWQVGTGGTKQLGGSTGGTPASWDSSITGSGFEAAAWAAPALDVDIAGALGTADLSSATAATINSIREAFQVQRLYERDARGGTRYTEILRSHFGVTSPDQRLQRPEYLGGGSTPILLTPVAQTNDKLGDPLGALAAYGTAQGGNIGFTKSFVEHSIIMGFVVSRADINYQQGLNRMFSRMTRFDYYWPALAHLGEQGVLNQEIFAQGGGGSPDEDIFGYQERYAEYRYKPSIVTGAMRSNHAAPLDTWHLAQEFGSLPVLDATFIEENPPMDRVIAITTEPHFLFDAFFDFKCARPMPTYSVPGQIDHF